jgi:O-antigen/teichoic acid export membrane protein
LVLVMAAGAVAGFVLGRPGIALLYGKQFLPAATPFYILLIAIIFQAASRVLRNYFYGMGRPQLTLWSSGAAALVTATAIFPLVRSFVVGAAAGALLAHGVGAVVDLVVAVRLSAAPKRQFVLPQKANFQIAAWKP